MTEPLNKTLRDFSEDMSDMLDSMAAVKGEGFSHAVALLFSSINLEKLTPAANAISVEFIRYLKCTQTLEYGNEVLNAVATLHKKAAEYDARIQGSL